MLLKKKIIFLKRKKALISVKRNSHGIPHIKANNELDLLFALGWVHAHDRLSQMLISRLLARGELCQHLIHHKLLLQTDKYMRRINLRDDAISQAKKIDYSTMPKLEAYLSGINKCMGEKKIAKELKILGYDPESWKLQDTIMVLKVMGFIGMSQSQGYAEKFIIQLIKQKISQEKIKELFPNLTETIDYDLIDKVSIIEPVVDEVAADLFYHHSFNASNCWALGPKKTKTGMAMLCNDPHVAFNHLPSIWAEVIMETPEIFLAGATVAGIPGLVIGRNKNISWGVTYGSMDNIDYFIEHCKNGKFRQANSYNEFTVRKEIIKIRRKKEQELTFYENQRGVLEGDPQKDGYYLTFAWSGRNNTGAIEITNILKLMKAANAREAMQLFSQMSFAAFNWTIADSKGNIAMQASGRLPKRKQGFLKRTTPKGLMALPGWEKKNQWLGFYSGSELPNAYNPSCRFIVTANNDLNKLGKAKPITLPIGDYRAQRIEDLLDNRDAFTLEDMKKMHFDVFSIQAQKIMQIIYPHLPDNAKGKLLKDWDFHYQEDSKAATLFENIYYHILMEIFAKTGNLSEHFMNFVIKQTAIFTGFNKNFDNILLQKKSSWFEDEDKFTLLKRAVNKGLKIDPKPYAKTRRFRFHHAFYGDKVPSLIKRFNLGPYTLKGSRATIHQGQILNLLKRKFFIGPSYRFIVNFQEPGIHTNLAGGPTDGIFSKYYATDIKNWLAGKYKYLKAD